MSATGEVRGFRWKSAPAVWDPEWIPPADQHPWPELAEMRATHVRLRAAASQASDAIAAADRAVEALRDQRQATLKDSYRDGTEPEVAEDEYEFRRDAEDAAASARERASAVTEALVEFLDEATAVIAERRPEWLGDLDAIESERQSAVEAAKRALAEAEADLGTTRRLRHWVDRTGGVAATLLPEHIPYAAIPVPAPQPNTLSVINGKRDEYVETQMRKQLTRPPMNQPSPEDKEALFDQMLSDIDRQERNEAEKGARNA